MDKPLRLKIAHYLTAAFPNQVKALKEDGILPADDPAAVREAEAFLREAATAVLFVADQDERRLKADHAAGEYREEVEKLVDGVVEDINGCKVASRAQARVQLANACGRSAYATDPALAAVVLTYSAHPSFYHSMCPPPRTTDPMPWPRMARAALGADACEELERRPQYQALPGG